MKPFILTASATVLVLLAGCTATENETTEAPMATSSSTAISTSPNNVAPDVESNIAGTQSTAAMPDTTAAITGSVDSDVVEQAGQGSAEPLNGSTTTTFANVATTSSTVAETANTATGEDSRSPDPEPEQASSDSSSSESVPTSTTSPPTSTTVTSAPKVPSAQSPTLDSTTTTTVQTLTPPEGEFVVLEVPPGTLERIEAGDSVEDILPPLTVARVGQTFIFRNLDSGTHYYGPVTARAGETIRWKLSSAGEFIGYCTVGDSRVVTLQVVEG